MNDCGPSDPSSPLAEQLAGYLDCHAQSIAHTGFSAFNGGWLGPALVGGLLTIYIALIGYRLLIGIPFGARDALLAAVRAGVVLALATGWPAYETMVYRLIFEAPAEVAGLILPSDLSASTLEETAQRLDRDLAALQGTAAPSPTVAATPINGVVQPGAEPTPAPPVAQQPQTSRNPDEPILRGARATLANITIGSLGAIRIIGGVLLGCGPLFILLALFDQTLGIFEGWARGVLTTFVAAIGATVVTALMLGFVEADLVPAYPSWMAPDPTLEPALLAVATFFATAMLAIVAGSMIVGTSFRLVRASKVAREPLIFEREGRQHAAPAWLATAAPSRADIVVDAVRRLTQREESLSILSRETSASSLNFSDRHSPGRSVSAAQGRRTSPVETPNLQRRDPRP